jgi:hypothetical protein
MLKLSFNRQGREVSTQKYLQATIKETERERKLFQTIPIKTLHTPSGVLVWTAKYSLLEQRIVGRK